jgi:hypothetical protein
MARAEQVRVEQLVRKVLKGRKVLKEFKEKLAQQVHKEFRVQ